MKSKHFSGRRVDRFEKTGTPASPEVRSVSAELVVELRGTLLLEGLDVPPERLEAYRRQFEDARERGVVARVIQEAEDFVRAASERSTVDPVVAPRPTGEDASSSEPL
jgi:hypothetical protein